MKTLISLLAVLTLAVPGAAPALAAQGDTVLRFGPMYTVPGGEHVPLHTFMPGWFTRWLGRMIERRSGYVPDLTEGEGPVVFPAGGATFAPLICYEIIYPGLVRSTLALEPDVLLNLSNYAWYPGTIQPEQAEDITIFRAVENRRPVVVSANNGISSIIDATGIVRKSIAKDAVGTLGARVPLTDAGSLYALVGDLFAWLSVAIVTLLAAGAVYSGRRNRARGGEQT